MIPIVAANMYPVMCPIIAPATEKPKITRVIEIIVLASAWILVVSALYSVLSMPTNADVAVVNSTWNNMEIEAICI